MTFDIADLGVTLAEAKRLLARVQQVIVAAQARDHAVSTLFGQATLQLPRFRCPACGGMEVGVAWPTHCRSTPELDRLQAHLCALMTYRTAADVLEQMFPVDAGQHHETLRRHTLKVGDALGEGAAIKPDIAASAIVVTLASTFIRSCADGGRHLEVRVGNVETKAGGRQVFGAVAKADTALQALIRRNLDAAGRTKDTVLTAFTDGCPGLRRILADAGVTAPPTLDWFHTAMRLQHLKQIASTLPADDPTRAEAKAVIVEEVERLHWRIWNRSSSHPTIHMHQWKSQPGPQSCDSSHAYSSKGEELLQRALRRQHIRSIFTLPARFRPTRSPGRPHRSA